jgi:hypothetical protein
VANSIASLRVDGKYMDDIAVIVDEKLDNPNDTFTKHDMYSMIRKEYPRQTNIFMYSATELLDSLFETSDTSEPHILSNPPPVSPCKSAHRKEGHAAYYRKVLAYHPTIALQWRYVMGMDACMTFHLPLVEMIFDWIRQTNKLLALLDPMRWSFRGRMKANLHSYGKKDHSKNPDCKFDSNAKNFLRHVINNANGQGGSGSGGGGGGGISARQQDQLPSSQQQQSSQKEEEEEEESLDQQLQLRRRLMEEEPANSSTSTSNGNAVNVTTAKAATTTISTLSSIGGTFGSDNKKKKRRGKKRKEKGPANVVEEQDTPAPTAAATAATATFRTNSTYSIGREVNATSTKKKEKKTGPRFEQDVLKSTPYFIGAMMMYDTSIVRNCQYVT